MALLDDHVPVCGDFSEDRGALRMGTHHRHGAPIRFKSEKAIGLLLASRIFDAEQTIGYQVPACRHRNPKGRGRSARMLRRAGKDLQLGDEPQARSDPNAQFQRCQNFADHQGMQELAMSHARQKGNMPPDEGVLGRSDDAPPLFLG